MSRSALTVTLASASLVLLSSTALAATISSISIQGVERVEQETVLSYLPFKVGQDFDASQTSRVVKSLYATGLFANVDVQENAGAVVVKVAENPMVNRVAFEGNDAIDTKRLEELTGLKARAIYSPAKVQADIQALQAAYRSRGRFTTQIKAQLIQRDQNRVDVVYVVEEAAKSSIASINFVGNERFSDGDLADVIATKRSAWWRFLSGNDTYDPARMDVDKDMLRRFYLSKGYADVQITSAVAELTRDKKDFILTYTVFEGPRYNVGKVDVTLNAEAQGLDVAALKKAVSLKTKDVFDATRVESNTDKLIDMLGNKGFAFLNVKPEFSKHEAERTMDVTFNVQPGPRVYVGRINFEGNDHTRDYVLRREMRLAEGDAYSADKLKRSKDRLTYLGYFENVDIKQKESDQPDRVDLDVKVKEQSTGEFNIGAGYSTFDGILATTDIKERNFMGKGQELDLKLNVSQRQQSFNVGFTEPYFMGRELAASTKLFNERTDYQSESSYDVGSMGTGVGFRFPLDEFTSNAVSLGIKTTKIDNVGSGASQFVKDQSGRRDALTLGNTYAIDTRDNALNPTRGYRVALSGEYTGFGLDTAFGRAQLNASWNTSVWDDWVFSVGGRTGVIRGLSNQSIPIYEHFMGGGNNLRGFEFGGIGPRDRATGDALGGRYMVGNSVELSFPLGSALKDMGVNGLVFSDGGMVTSFDSSNKAGIVDSKTYRLSAGAGIFWRSPIGPLRLEFGMPVVKASEDRDQIFSLSVGSHF